MFDKNQWYEVADCFTKEEALVLLAGLQRQFPDVEFTAAYAPVVKVTGITLEHGFDIITATANGFLDGYRQGHSDGHSEGYDDCMRDHDAQINHPD